MTPSADKRGSAGRFDRLRKRQHWLRHLPWLVLAATLAGSWQLWRYAEQNILRERQAAFDLRVREAAAQIRQRLGAYEQLLYGVRGFLSTKRSLDHNGFSAYVRSLEVGRILPGVEGVSYIPLVAIGQQRAHIAAMRRDGLPGYHIHPASGAGPVAPLAYVEPQSVPNLSLTGLDAFANPAWRRALTRATDAGQPTISDRLPLSGDASARREGRVMLLPVYRAGAPHRTVDQRRANLAGWIAAYFQVSQLMAGLFPDTTRDLSLELYDGGPVSSSARAGAAALPGLRAASPSGFAEVHVIEVGGRTWQVRARSLPAFDAAIDRSKAHLTALSAVLLSILLTGLTAFLVRDRSRALRLAEGVNSELRRNQAFQAILEEKERRWKLALEAVGDGVWDWDLTTGQMTYSPQFEEMLGYAPGELERDHADIIRRIHPDDRERSHREFMDYLRGNTATYASERRVQCKDGSWKWMLARGMAMDRGPDGRYRRMIGTHTDISRRRTMERALQDARRISDDIINSLPGVFFMFDMEGRMVRWNRSMERTTGYAASQVSHLTPADLVAPEDLPALQQAIARVFEFGAAEIEAWLRLKNGDRISHQFTARRTTIAGQHYLIGVGMDISARLAAEAAVRENEERYRAIFSSAQDFIFTIDTANRLTSVTDYFCEVMGCGMDEILGAPIAQFFTPESMMVVRKMIALKLENRATVTRYEADMVTRQGRLIPVEINSALILKDGKILGSQGIARDITERRRQEEALRESEERYRGAFDDGNYFIFTLDARNRLTYATPALAQLLGYSVDELQGAPAEQLLTEDGLQTSLAQLSLKQRGVAAVTQYETEMRRVDGRTLPVEVTTRLIFRHGKAVGVRGAGRDITERRNYEKALLESEEKYRGLFESAGDFAYSTDLAGSFVAISESLLQVTGYERSELLSITQILAPDQLALAREMTAAKVSGDKRATRYELEITARDGRRVPLEIVSTLVYRQDRPVGVQGIGRDMADRKRAEELLRRSERNYRELMEQAAEAIFVADHEGRHYVDANRAACDLLGYTRDELIGMPFAAVFHPEDINDDPINYAEMWAGQIIHTRRRFRRKDGSYIPVELSARMLADGRLQALGRDISTWIEREAALQQSNLRAEAASRAKSEFLANMSHEIRTPMNSVIGMARLALARETEARQIGYLEKILMSGEHLLGIIDDILDFSKIEAGKIRIERTSFELSAVMENLKQLVADKAIAKGLELHVAIDSSLPGKVQGDPLRLRQVLLNFVDNAIKFTSRGGVCVSVRREEGAADGSSTVFFEVADTGIGLTQAEMAMLFRPFQQSDGSVTRKYGGTGLGLSISKRLVELMGGETGVESVPGEGSKFWFRLRLDEGRGEGFDMPQQFTDGRDTQAVIRSARILLAENNVLNQQVAREFLEIAGCVVQVAANGHEVLDLLQHEHFDCILMDIQMPQLDGLEATRQIRANPAFAAIPVIAVTANALEEERQRCLAAGMNDFLTKPLRPETLYAVLAKWLSRRTLPFSLPDRRVRQGELNPAHAAAIDFSVLYELVGGNPDKMRQMAHKFLETAQEDMEKVRMALDAADLPALKQMGHHIKSPAAMVGAGQLAGLCQALEANQQGLEGARDLVDRMRGTLAEIEDEIRMQFP